MKHALVAVLATLALAVGGFSLTAYAAAGGGDGQVCGPLDSGKIDTPAAGTTLTVTAPAGQLIDGYCVKAGSAKQGNGPVYVTVDPPAASVTISHPSGKDISHYSVSYTTVPTDPTDPPTDPTDPPTDPTDPPTEPTDPPTDPTTDPTDPTTDPTDPTEPPTTDPTGPPTLIPPTSDEPDGDGTVTRRCVGNALVIKHYDEDGDITSTSTINGHRRCAPGAPSAPGQPVQEEGM